MTPIEEAQVRVAKAEDAKRGLLEEITGNKKYGSLKGLDDACHTEREKEGPMATLNGKAHQLRIRYNRAVKELRLAKSDLARKRNEEGQKAKAVKEELDEEDCDGCDRQYAPESELCRTCKPKEDGAPSNFSDAGPEIYWEGGPIDTIREMPWFMAITNCPEDSAVNLLPGSYEYLVTGKAPISVSISEPYQVIGPMSPYDALRGIIKQHGPKPEPVTKPKVDLDNCSTYGELLAQYRGLCREIEGLGYSYGNPTPEERKLKKERLELRKTLRSMAPLKTCWFCSGFSINNFDSPCREGALGRGDVPKEACDCWAVGYRYVDESCLVAWPEFQELKNERARQDEDAVRDAGKISDDAREVKKTALEVMEENAQKAETKKATRQVDLNGNPLKLPEGVKETRKVSKSRLYEEERFKLRISEDDLYDFAGLWSEHQREIVAAKLRPKKGVIPARGELDDEIDHMIKVLVIASMNFKQERILEEARAKALAQVI